ncbi:MAG: radical SAM protein [bacterium]|nr:radical SAM protein [bacterium]
MENYQLIQTRGLQVNIHNPINRFKKVPRPIETLDGIGQLAATKTNYLEVFPKNIIDRTMGPDLSLAYSINPYQGDASACIYSYTRNSLTYWGYRSGAEFDQKILVKKNAAKLLEDTFQKSNWAPAPISIMADSAYYQAAERKFGITRQILEICLKYRNPVCIVTNNALVERDLDLLIELNNLQLVNVSMCFSSMDEQLRRLLEPHAASANRKLKTIETLVANNIPVNVMMTPIIPGLNSHEILSLAEKASVRGASTFSCSIIRLNGSIGNVFMHWISKTFPNKAANVIHQIQECHTGHLNDNRIEKKMNCEGKTTDMITEMATIAREKFFKGRSLQALNCGEFMRNKKGQLGLF